MVRPLSKTTGTGERYQRPPEVEAEIEAALAQDQATIERRLGTTDHASPDHLRSETLVHLARDLRRREQYRLADLARRVLLIRCDANLKAKPSGKVAAAMAEDILGNFSELFAIDAAGSSGNELDFYECKFNRAFRTFRASFVRRETRRMTHETRMPEAGHEAESDDGEDVRAWLSPAFHSAAEQDGSASLNELKAAIYALPEEERLAVVLCHVLGYDVESIDPTKRTAATLCGVSGRTIRNRLASAAKKLSRFKENV